MMWANATALAAKWDLEAAARAATAAAASLEQQAAVYVDAVAVKAAPADVKVAKILTPQQLVDSLTVITSSMTNAVIIEFRTAALAEQAASKLFRADTEVESVNMVDQYLLLTRKPTKRVRTWETKIQSSFGRGVSVTAVTLKSLKKSAIQWTTLHERVITVDMGPAVDGMHRRVKDGRAVVNDGISNTITEQIGNMRKKSSPKQRNHPFDDLVINNKLIDTWTAKLAEETIRIYNTYGRAPLGTDPMVCGCRPNCVQPLQVQGPDRWSNDREINPIGYTEAEQTLRIISKRHNVRTKHDSVPQPRAQGDGWDTITSLNMVEHTTYRINRIEDLLKPTADHKKTIKFFDDNPELFTQDAYKELLIQLKAEYQSCAKCNIKLHFGDAKGILRTKSNPSQASPDRIDNTNEFYISGNVQLVCLGCQDVEQHNNRRPLKHEQSGDTQPLLFDHAYKIIAILRNRQAKAEEVEKKRLGKLNKEMNDK